MVDGLLWCQETCIYAVVDISSFEAYPIALPTNAWIWIVGVPLTRKEQEHIACLQSCAWTMITLEPPLAIGVIEQLVFIEPSSFFYIEIIAVRVSFCGIGIIGRYFFISYGANSESPEGIPFISQHIFTDLHSL